MSSTGSRKRAQPTENDGAERARPDKIQRLSSSPAGPKAHTRRRKSSHPADDAQEGSLNYDGVHITKYAKRIFREIRKKWRGLHLTQGSKKWYRPSNISTKERNKTTKKLQVVRDLLRLKRKLGKQAELEGSDSDAEAHAVADMLIETNTEFSLDDSQHAYRSPGFPAVDSRRLSPYTDASSSRCTFDARRSSLASESSFSLATSDDGTLVEENSSYSPGYSWKEAERLQQQAREALVAVDKLQERLASADAERRATMVENAAFLQSVRGLAAMVDRVAGRLGAAPWSCARAKGGEELLDEIRAQLQEADRLIGVWEELARALVGEVRRRDGVISRRDRELLAVRMAVTDGQAFDGR